MEDNKGIAFGNILSNTSSKDYFIPWLVMSTIENSSSQGRVFDDDLDPTRSLKSDKGNLDIAATYRPPKNNIAEDYEEV